MKYLLGFLILLLFSHSAFAQQPPINLDWLVTAPIYRNGGTMIVNDIAVGKDGATIAVGYFSGTVDFEPGADTFDITASSKYDIFICKYSKDGKLIYVHAFGSKGNTLPEAAYGVATDDEDDVYVTGNFNGTIDFDPEAGSTLLTTASTTEVFVASYDSHGAFRYAVQATNTGATTRTQTGKSIVVDRERNAYITGSFSGKADFDPGNNVAYLSSAGKLDLFFAKYNKNGGYVWAKRVGGESSDEGNKIVLDKNNNLILCGYFSSPMVDFNPGNDTAFLPYGGKEDLFFAKYDTAGHYIFAKGIGGSNDEIANSIIVGTDNSIIVTGSFASKNVDFNTGSDSTFLSASSSYGDCFITKYDANGNFAFAFKIGDTTRSGYNSSSGSDIGVDSNNNIVIVGSFSDSLVDFDPGPRVYHISTAHGEDNFVAKYTAAGSFIFANGVGNQSYLYWLANTYIRCVQTTGKGSIITGGSFSDTLDVDPGPKIKNIFAPGLSLLLTKYDSNGVYFNSIHANDYHDYYNNSADIRASATDKDGNIYVAGDFNGLFDFDPGPAVYLVESQGDYASSLFFAKYDKNRKILFAKVIVYGGSDAIGLAVDKNQNIYLSGTGFSSADFDPSDSGVQHWNNDTSNISHYGFFFAKYSATGDFVFVKGIYNDLEGNAASAIAVDGDKSIYLAGNFGNQLDFDPSMGTHYLTASGQSDLFYAKYDSLGNYLFAEQVGAAGTNYSNVYSMVLSGKGNLLLCGNFTGTNVDFDPGVNQYLLSAGSSGGGYVATYRQNGTFVNAFALTSTSKSYYDFKFSALCTDASDDIYLSGNFYGKIDFDPGTPKVYLPAGQGFYLASYTSTGSLRFSKGSYAYDYESAGLSSLALDKNNNVYAGGSSSAPQIDLDFGPDSAILVNEQYTTSNELFMAKYDSLGNYLSNSAFTNDGAKGGSGRVTGLQISKYGDLYLTGYYTSKIDFDPGPDSVLALPTTRYSNLFIAKYSPAAEPGSDNKNVFSRINKNIVPPDSKNKISFYPNPVITSGSISLMDTKACYVQIEMLGSNGTVYLKLNKGLLHAGTYSIPINFSNLPGGIYMITVSAGKSTYQQKIVK